MKVNAEDVAYSFALCFRLCRRWSMTHDASQRRPIAKLNAHIQWLSPSIIAALQQTDVFHATAQVDSVKSPLFITYTAPTYPPPLSSSAISTPDISSVNVHSCNFSHPVPATLSAAKGSVLISLRHSGGMHSPECRFTLLCFYCRKTHNPWPVVQASYCAQCPPTLDDVEYRQFWISWKAGIIAYGNGSLPGINVAGVFADPTPIAVNYMSIASHAAVVADWIIPGHLQNTSIGRTFSCSEQERCFYVLILHLQNNNVVFTFTFYACTYVLRLHESRLYRSISVVY